MVGTEHEEAVRTFLQSLECEKLDSSRIEHALTAMAPDARYHLYAWEEPFVGHGVPSHSERGEVILNKRSTGDDQAVIALPVRFEIEPHPIGSGNKARLHGPHHAAPQQTTPTRISKIVYAARSHSRDGTMRVAESFRYGAATATSHGVAALDNTSRRLAV